MTTKEHHISEPRINERIRVPEVRLVGPNGEQVGIVRVEDALRLAAEADLDLVEVAPMARPPVAKLMDFGKYKYEAAMKAREARKNQVNTVIKEIKLRPKIDPHDYGTKKGHVERFLKAGDKVKVTIMFRGREQSRPELGFRLLQRLAADIGELGFVESAPKQDGRNMVMVIGPTKKKSEAKAEARRARETTQPASSTHGRTERSSEPTAAAPVTAPAEPAVAEPPASAPEPVVGSTEVPPSTPVAPAEPVVEHVEEPASEAAAPEATTPADAPAPAAGPKPTPRPAAPRPAAPRASTTKAATPKPATPRPAAAAAKSATPRTSAPKPAAPRASAPKPGPRSS